MSLKSYLLETVSQATVFDRKSKRDYLVMQQRLLTAVVDGRIRRGELHIMDAAKESLKLELYLLFYGNYYTLKN